MNTGMELVFEIPGLSAVITFGISGFTVDLPYKYFGNNTQGHCGRNIIFTFHYSFFCFFFLFFKCNFIVI